MHTSEDCELTFAIIECPATFAEDGGPMTALGVDTVLATSGCGFVSFMCLPSLEGLLTHVRTAKPESALLEHPPSHDVS